MEKSKPPKKHSVWRTLRNRIMAGLFVALPLFITFLVLDWIYRLLMRSIIGPIANQLLKIWFPEQTETEQLPFLIEYVLGPLVALMLVLSVLFVAGMLFQSRLHRTVDWILLNVPGINLIYSAVKNVVDAVQKTNQDIEKFDRVVLIEFPHPGCKAPAFVTSECKDLDTGQTILSIYVPTTPVPTSGYMLLIPEHKVIPLEWNVQDTIQAIISGGLTLPDTVRFESPALKKLRKPVDPS